jgi:aquaporin Z
MLLLLLDATSRRSLHLTARVERAEMALREWAHERGAEARAERVTRCAQPRLIAHAAEIANLIAVPRMPAARVCAAETAGTALLVWAILLAVGVAMGEGSPIARALPGPGLRLLLVGVLVAPCVALITLSPLGRLSGAHLNPAVSLAFWGAGRLPRDQLLAYLGGQLLGGLLGALAGRVSLPASTASSIGGAVTHPAVSAGAAIAVEAGMTALLLGVIFTCLSREWLMRWTPLAIVPVLIGVIWLGSAITGASLNPARSEGPALVFGDTRDLWIYLFAPSLAGLVVGRLARRVVPAVPMALNAPLAMQ